MRSYNISQLDSSEELDISTVVPLLARTPCVLSSKSASIDPHSFWHNQELARKTRIFINTVINLIHVNHAVVPKMLEMLTRSFPTYL